jgi:pimeloyl-ACP methyl ester carboxylesterase
MTPFDTREAMVPIGDCRLFVLEQGPVDGPAVLFLHGWPQSHRAWQAVLPLAAAHGCRAVALDLPGIGRSTGEATDGSTGALASVVHELVTTLGLTDLTLVGHDLGGMIGYSYLRRFTDLARAVVMDTVVPGVPPWEQVLANPYIWHFAFHAIPDLPERLVQGHQRAYFDYFFDVLSPERSGISAESRDAYAAAYASDEELRAGFAWYRQLPVDARDNAAAGGEVGTPLLYLRGEHERGDLSAYVDGFTGAGLTRVRSAVVGGAGHFAPEDNPDEVWAQVREFIERTPPVTR